MNNETAVLLGCKCGWVGMAHSSPSALQNWHNHVFDAVGGSHERINEMAVSMPADGKAIDVLIEQITGLNALGRFRKHEHLPFEREGLALVEQRRQFSSASRT